MRPARDPAGAHSGALLGTALRPAASRRATPAAPGVHPCKGRIPSASFTNFARSPVRLESALRAPGGGREQVTGRVSATDSRPRRTHAATDSRPRRTHVRDGLTCRSVSAFRSSRREPGWRRESPSAFAPPSRTLHRSLARPCAQPHPSCVRPYPARPLSSPLRDPCACRPAPPDLQRAGCRGRRRTAGRTAEARAWTRPKHRTTAP